MVVLHLLVGYSGELKCPLSLCSTICRQYDPDNSLIYVAVSLFQDICKVALYHVMKKYNILRINETGALILPESTKIYMANEKKKRDAMASACASKHAAH